jgi:hypothetical protein
MENTTIVRPKTQNSYIHHDGDEIASSKKRRRNENENTNASQILSLSSHSDPLIPTVSPALPRAPVYAISKNHYEGNLFHFTGKFAEIPLSLELFFNERQKKSSNIYVEKTLKLFRQRGDLEPQIKLMRFTEELQYALRAQLTKKKIKDINIYEEDNFLKEPISILKKYVEEENNFKAKVLFITHFSEVVVDLVYKITNQCRICSFSRFITKEELQYALVCAICAYSEQLELTDALVYRLFFRYDSCFCDIYCREHDYFYLWSYVYSHINYEFLINKDFIEAVAVNVASLCSYISENRRDYFPPEALKSIDNILFVIKNNSISGYPKVEMININVLNILNSIYQHNFKEEFDGADDFQMERDIPFCQEDIPGLNLSMPEICSQKLFDFYPSELIQSFVGEKIKKTLELRDYIPGNRNKCFSFINISILLDVKIKLREKKLSYGVKRLLSKIKKSNNDFSFFIYNGCDENASSFFLKKIQSVIEKAQNLNHLVLFYKIDIQSGVIVFDVSRRTVFMHKSVKNIFFCIYYFLKEKFNILYFPPEFLEHLNQREKNFSSLIAAILLLKKKPFYELVMSSAQ